MVLFELPRKNSNRLTIFSGAQLEKPQLLSFSDGGLQWRLAAKRFKSQSQQSLLFSQVNVESLSSTSAISPGVFEGLEAGFFKSPGLGYWIWKPLVIYEALRSMPRSSEFLIYSDIGCSVNSTPRSSRRLQEYLEIASVRDVLTFSLPGFKEQDWTKPEVLEHFNAPPEARSSDQRIATVIVFRNSSSTRELVHQWVEAATLEGGRLLNNQTEPSKLLPSFRAHRNDQSLWSVISKASGVEAIPDETYFAPNWKSEGKDYPFWATRLKSIFSSPNPTFLQKAATKVISYIP